MRVMLLSTPSEDPMRNEPSYSLGIAYLGAVIEKAGHHVSGYDFFTAGWKKAKKRIKKLIEKEKPEIVGISCLSMNRVSSFKTAKLVKEIDPNIKVVMGGVHASSLYKQILENFPVDIICIGEGEETIVELLDVLEKGKSLDRIKGIAYRKGEKIIRTAPREFIKDLDSIPFPKHDFFKDYIDKKKTAYVITSRGCPMKCIFCSTSHYWGITWRARSAKNVVDELEILVKKFGVKHVFFHDDTFTLDNQRVIDICKGIEERGLKFTWNCSARVNPISEEMLRWMARTGCKWISFGVESGSPKLLKTIRKRITPEQVIHAFRLARKVGIEPVMFLFVGTPGENQETIRETMNLIDETDSKNILDVGILEIYPNTPLYELAKRQGIINDEFWLTEKRVPHYTYEWSEEELRQFANQIVLHSLMKRGKVGFLKFGLSCLRAKPVRTIELFLERDYLRTFKDKFFKRFL